MTCWPSLDPLLLVCQHAQRVCHFTGDSWQRFHCTQTCPKSDSHRFSISKYLKESFVCLGFTIWRRTTITSLFWPLALKLWSCFSSLVLWHIVVFWGQKLLQNTLSLSKAKIFIFSFFNSFSFMNSAIVSFI